MVRPMDDRASPPRVFALAGALEPIWLLGTAALFGSFRAGYDATHAISELGEQGAPGALMWNVAGFGIAALLHVLFALAIRAAIGDGWLFRVGVLQAIFLAGGGTFGCDPGCPPVMSSWQGWVHVFVGLSYFALTCIAPLVAWRAFRRDRSWRRLAPASLVAGLILVALFIAGPVLFPPAAVGVWQRITLATAGSWTTVVAIRLWRIRGTQSGLDGGDASAPLPEAVSPARRSSGRRRAAHHARR